MNLINRRASVAAIAALLGSVASVKGSRAQFSENEVRNGLQVTSTGNVTVEQAASGNQAVRVYIDGQLTTMNLENLAPGIYQTETGQMVVNDSQITSTGDVDVVQSASGQQEVTVVRRQQDWYDGMPASSCSPGAVIASPHGVLYFQKDDCCYYLVPCIPCQQECRGDVCSGKGK